MLVTLGVGGCQVPRNPAMGGGDRASARQALGRDMALARQPWSLPAVEDYDPPVLPTELEFKSLGLK